MHWIKRKTSVLLWDKFTLNYHAQDPYYNPWLIGNMYIFLHFYKMWNMLFLLHFTTLFRGVHKRRCKQYDFFLHCRYGFMKKYACGRPPGVWQCFITLVDWHLLNQTCHKASQMQCYTRYKINRQVYYVRKATCIELHVMQTSEFMNYAESHELW